MMRWVRDLVLSSVDKVERRGVTGENEARLALGLMGAKATVAVARRSDAAGGATRDRIAKVVAVGSLELCSYQC